MFSLFLKGRYLLSSLAVHEAGTYESIWLRYIHSVKKNDAYCYGSIAREGYAFVEERKEIGFFHGSDHHQSNWAFFR